jgi:hypothetical protein
MITNIGNFPAETFQINQRKNSGPGEEKTAAKSPDNCSYKGTVFLGVPSFFINPYKGLRFIN